MKLISKYPLITLFIFAITLRVAFSFYFQQFYFGEFTWETADTYTTYINPFLNLMAHGEYMGDLYIEDSRYYAVPIYPFFIGTVYHLFGSELAVYIIAFLQSLLGAFSTVFVFKIIFNMTYSKKMAIVSALIFAMYPFEIIWSPIGVTETMYVFWGLMLIYLITQYKIDTLKMAFISGVVVGIGTLTKQHLGALIIIPLMVILFPITDMRQLKKKFLSVIFVLIGLGTVLSPWIIRNYIHSGKVIILKGETVGIRGYGKDFRAFEKFANLFNQNITPLVNEVVRNGRLTLTKHKEFVDKHHEEIQKGAYLAHSCGPAFVERRISTAGKAPYKNDKCEEEVIKAFNILTDKFWEETPFTEAIETRIEAVKKAYLKSDIVNQKVSLSKTDFMKKMLFFYRTFLLTLGIIGLILLIKSSFNNITKNIALGIGIFSFIIYFLISVIHVHVEIRYLLLPDVLLSILAPWTVIQVIEFIKKLKGD